ncbi:MAG: S8 family serine peptidase [Bacilli bacterium]|nr:S8 family serine peptidase [Bacilli bacterium]MDD4076679.1 S8 family serine peptidase [Bacilli bacterium]
MKKIFGYVSIVISLLFISDLRNHNFEKGIVSENEKLVFEISDSSITAESSSKKIANSLTKFGDYVSVAIELEDSFDGMIEEPDYPVSIEEAQEIVKRQREMVKAHYTKENGRLTKELGLGFMEADVEISKYSNFVFLNYRNNSLSDYHVDQIKTISNNNQVSKVYVRCNNTKNARRELYALKSKIFVEPYVIDHPEFNGSGISVGVLDVGIIDKNHPNFVGTDYLIRDEWWYWETVDEHSTTVGLTIAGNTGIAPAARLLSVEFFMSYSGPIEWLLDQGANIINISMCNGSTHGVYTSDAAYLDYIIRNNSVLIVGSAGNRGDSREGGDYKVTSPKTGFNVITVGNTGAFGDPTLTTSYITNFSISKPNISAPAELLYLPGFPGVRFGGTSYAAAMVSGVSALVMQSDSRYIIRPHILGALLAATATPSYFETDFDSSGYEKKIGAGIINCEFAITNKTNTFCFYNNTNKQGEVVFNHRIYLTGGKRVKVVFYALVNSDKSKTIKTTDYDLYLKHDNGQILQLSCSSYNNSELINCIVPYSGYYQVEIVQYGSKKTDLRDFCAYSYYQFDPNFSSYS